MELVPFVAAHWYQGRSPVLGGFCRILGKVSVRFGGILGGFCWDVGTILRGFCRDLGGFGGNFDGI